jgi:S-adenosylmethionine decarboxylase
MVEKNDFDCEGRLVALDLYGCSFESLNSPGFLVTETNKAAQMAQMRVLAITLVPFKPQGLSITLTLAESHLAIHTSPELGYAAVDIFTCGGGNPMKAAEHLRKVLNPKVTLVNSQRRGMLPPSEKGVDHRLSPGEPLCLSVIKPS